ncbi:MAG TPA: hypothetical protein DEV75_12225 [Desulfovibrio sp.]|jgi:hypothetical protein|nr:hypothetical protein [Desulfovibrio sp.]
MKRNWDIIRDILIEVEEIDPANRRTTGFDFEQTDDPSQSLKNEHIHLLFRSGFIEGIDVSSQDGGGMINPNLTWEGHDLLDTIRSKPIWEKIKSLAQAKGIELTFDAVKALGVFAYKQILAD